MEDRELKKRLTEELKSEGKRLFQRMDERFLDSRFEVWGSFYEVSLGGKIEECRNCLEIIRKEEDSQFLQEGAKRQPFEGTPQALLIAMNPGGSKPISSCDSSVPLGEDFITKVCCVNPVEAVPDKMQYNVMRVMEVFGWSHMRVINLSDFRDTSSENFAAWQSRVGDSRHSIFCRERRDELLVAIGQTPVIIPAWSMVKKLRPLIDLALEGLHGRELTGVIGARENGYYRYPTPLRSIGLSYLWLGSIVKLIKDKGLAEL